MSSCCLGARSIWGRGRGWSIVLCMRVVRVIRLRWIVRVVLLGWVGVELLCISGRVGRVEGHPAGAVVRWKATTAAAAGYAPEYGG